MLLGCYRRGDANDPDIYVRAVASVLGEYPLEVIKWVCDPRHGLPSKSEWLPTVSEVKKACEEAMAPIDRRRRMEEAAEERRTALSPPVFERPTLDELKVKHGDNWGLHPEGSEKTKWQPRSLKDICKEAGVSLDDFEAINTKAEKYLRLGRSS